MALKCRLKLYSMNKKCEVYCAFFDVRLSKKGETEDGKIYNVV